MGNNHHWHCSSFCFAALLNLVMYAATAVDAFSAATPPPHILVCDVPDDVQPVLARYESDGRAVVHHITADDDGVFRRLQQGDLDAFIIRSSNTVTAVGVQELPSRVRVIGRAGVGCDNIDLEACRRANLPVVTAAGANAVAVAEHTLALFLALARRIKPAVKSVERGEWIRPSLTGMGLRGKTAGVIGFGAIGAQVASLCCKLGMHVLVAPPASGSFEEKANDQRRQRLMESGAEAVDTLVELFKRSDIVSVHLPLTETTRNFISREELNQMKPTAYLVTTARGGVIDEAALLESVKSGGIAGAALDVFESEGPNFVEDAVLMQLARLDSVIITPHLGGHTAESQVDVWTVVMERTLQHLSKSQG